MEFGSVEEFIAFFETTCEKERKLFIPDPPRQEKVAKNLLDFHGKYHTHDILARSVDYHIKTNIGPFLVFDFAIGINNAREHVLTEIASQKNFDDLLNETKKRMEGF